MKVSHYVTYTVLLTLLWMQVYASVREAFSGQREAEIKMERMGDRLRQSQLQQILLTEHFLEFRQDVATLMPNTLRDHGMGEEGYPFRNLASIVSHGDAEKIQGAVAKNIFMSGKELFRKRDYAKANQQFKKIINQFSYTPFIVEALFLTAEGYFQMDRLEEATTTIQHMIEVFPSHELTGFAMVRLGRIYEIQNRNEEAVDIYRTVLRSFPQRDVASQAKVSLKGMDL